MKVVGKAGNLYQTYYYTYWTYQCLIKEIYIFAAIFRPKLDIFAAWYDIVAAWYIGLLYWYRGIAVLTL